MYVCICHAVTDRQIRQAVDEGVRTMRELRQRFGLCSRCGKCGPCAKEVLSEHLPKACQSVVAQDAA
jgi:Bacterioferritin-associated ferredoxin